MSQTRRGRSLVDRSIWRNRLGTIFARCGRSIMATLTAHKKRTSVRGLGEIALRVNDLDAMQKFYEQVIGLPPGCESQGCSKER